MGETRILDFHFERPFLYYLVYKATRASHYVVELGSFYQKVQDVGTAGMLNEPSGTKGKFEFSYPKLLIRGIF